MMNDIMINLRLQALSMALSLTNPDQQTSAEQIGKDAATFFEFIVKDSPAPDTGEDNVVKLQN